MRKAIALAILVLGLAFALTACGPPARTDLSTPPTPSVTASPSAPATTATNPTPTVAPIRDLADAEANANDPERMALLVAAHAHSGIADKTYRVWQLLAQGDVAVGDLQGASSAKRLLVVFQKDAGTWTVAVTDTFLDASEAKLKKAVPAVGAALAKKVDFVVPVKVDPFFAKSRAAMRMMSGASVIYAPTRLPEGFTASARSTDGSINIEYTKGAKRLTYFAWISGEYGEGERPKATFTGLRFGGLEATMDAAFFYRTDSSKRGPFLTAAGGSQVVSGLGVSPGMVAAVAASMVKVK